jgi:hypothetical protein
MHSRRLARTWSSVSPPFETTWRAPRINSQSCSIGNRGATRKLRSSFPSLCDVPTSTVGYPCLEIPRAAAATISGAFSAPGCGVPPPGMTSTYSFPRMPNRSMIAAAAFWLVAGSRALINRGLGRPQIRSFNFSNGVSAPAMNSGYAIQCSSMKRIHRHLNALRLCLGRELRKTMRAPALYAALSCAVRPALSKITIVGCKSRMSSETSRG